MAEYKEPAWPAGGQEIDTDPRSNSLLYKRDPFIITGYLIQFLRLMFSDAAQIRTDLLKEYLWTEDVATSKLLIDASFRVDVRNTMQRPAILVKRDEVAPIMFGLGDGEHHIHLERTGSPAEGTFKGVDFTNVIKGVNTILCIGTSAAEVENIALEVFFKMLEYKKVLKKELNVGKFIVKGLSPVNKLEENQENWLATVQVEWYYTHEWTVFQEAPVLKKISVNNSLT